MCGGQRYCFENSIRTVHVGEGVITTDLHGSYISFRNSTINGDAGRRHVPNGATVLICEVPEQIQNEYGVRETETVTFVEVTNDPFDLVRFENVVQPVPLKRFGKGVRFDILALENKPAPSPDPPKSQTTKRRNRILEGVGQLVSSIVAAFTYVW